MSTADDIAGSFMGSSSDIFNDADTDVCTLGGSASAMLLPGTLHDNIICIVAYASKLRP